MYGENKISPYVGADIKQDVDTGVSLTGEYVSSINDNVSIGGVG